MGLFSALSSEPLQRLNGYKNVLSLVVNFVAALLFVLFARDNIDWLVVALIAEAPSSAASSGRGSADASHRRSCGPSSSPSAWSPSSSSSGSPERVPAQAVGAAPWGRRVGVKVRSLRRLPATGRSRMPLCSPGASVPSNVADQGALASVVASSQGSGITVCHDLALPGHLPGLAPHRRISDLRAVSRRRPRLPCQQQILDGLGDRGLRSPAASPSPAQR